MMEESNIIGWAECVRCPKVLHAEPIGHYYYLNLKIGGVADPHWHERGLDVVQKQSKLTIISAHADGGPRSWVCTR